MQIWVGFGELTAEEKPNMIRRLMRPALAALLLVPACSESPTELATPAQHRLAVLSSSIDLTDVLEFAALPDLTTGRRAEKFITAAEGGLVELNGFVVEIPAGALPADTLITIDLPSDELLGKRVLVELGPHGIQFNQPVTISVPLEGVIIPPGTLNVARWENEAWVPLGGVISPDGKRLSSETRHFSAYSGHVMAGG